MVESSGRILLIADDPRTLRYWRVALSASGFQILVAGTAAEGETLAEGQTPDVILLDLNLSDMDGVDSILNLRKRCDAPIIAICVQGREEDAIQVLEAGADDCLIEPISGRDMTARIRAALRGGTLGHRPVSPLVCQIGNWSVDHLQHEVRVEGQRVTLSSDEYQLLITLVRYAGRVLTHNRLIREAWGDLPGAHPRDLSVYISQLRHKLEQNPARPKYLITEPGIGYRLRTE